MRSHVCHATMIIPCGFALLLLNGCDLLGFKTLAEGEKECEGGPCAPSRWLAVSVLEDEIHPATPWRMCDQHYAVEFASPDNPVISASINWQLGLLLATVTQDGLLHLSEFGAANATQELDVDGLGVAWSHAGDRLALVRRGAGSTDYTLDLLTPELDSLQSYPLTLPAALAADPVNLGFWSLAVSWNASDTRIAVSTVAGEAGAQIVDVQTGETSTFTIMGAYFIADDALVATDPACRPCAALYDLVGADLLKRGVIPFCDKVIASHPSSGVFVTVQSNFIVNAPDYHVGLRTAELGPSDFDGAAYDRTHDFVYGPVSLVPIEEATRALEAAGYGPENVIEPDPVTGGCPDVRTE